MRIKQNGILIGVMLFGAAACAMRPVDPEGFFSPSGALDMYDLGCELYRSPNPAPRDNSLAMLMFVGALDMNEEASYAYEDILVLGARDPRGSYVQLVRAALRKYINSRANLSVMEDAVAYLLSAMEIREQREQLLTSLLKVSEITNDVFTAELQLHMALLAAERADFQKAMQWLQQSYEKNPYNPMTFRKVIEIANRFDKEIATRDIMLHYRRLLQANPYHLDRVIEMARYAEFQEMFELAAPAYEYAANLYDYLNPDTELPAFIYLPWSLAGYQSQSYKRRCIDIAERVRAQGDFNLVIEALAGLAAREAGNASGSANLLSAVQKAEGRYEAKDGSVSAVQIAWFYLFGLENPEKALAWSNRAYSSDPNAAEVRSMLGYALAMDGQYELAQEMVEGLHEQYQVAALAYGSILLQKESKDLAIEVLKRAVKMAPETLEAAEARELLREAGSDYIPGTASDEILSALRQQFNDKLLPDFLTVSERLSVKLSFSGDAFSHGTDMKAALILVNNSQEPIVLSGQGFYNGLVRIDAIVSGDINEKIENLVLRKFTYGELLKPGQYYSIEMDMRRGRLQEILMTYPQANLEIEFLVYLDPLVDEEGELRQSLSGRGEARALIQRPGVGLTRTYLIQRFNTLSKGTVGQRLRVLDLLAGLLREQYAFEEEALYRYVYVERPLLEDAIRLALADDDELVRLHTLTRLGFFDTELPFEITQAVSENLTNKNWAIRLMALYVLSRQDTGNFKQVLDWAAEFDARPLVKQAAVILGGTPPPPPEDEGISEPEIPLDSVLE